jgi:hypothetical protein
MTTSLCLGMWAGQALGPVAIAQPATVGSHAGTGGCGSWTLVYSPNPLDEDTLHGVAAVSATDAWAVGHAFDEYGPDRPLIEHWDGAAWTEVATSLPESALLWDATALASDDAWAVGVNTDSPRFPFTAHWDGSTWSSVPVPNPGRSSAELLGVTALASDDVWAVGWREGPEAGADRTLVEHWDGSSWSVVPSPSPGVGQQLNEVSGSSATDVWAVGWSLATIASHNQYYYHPLIEHWDGSRWSVVKNSVSGSEIQLTGVAAMSATDAWAVGFTGLGSGSGQVFVERWDGSGWHPVEGPRPPYSQLNAVAGGAPDDVWMAGFGPPEAETLVEHWDGASLTIVPSSGWSDENTLEAVDVLPSGEAWTAGWYYSDNGKRYTMTQHFVPC